MQVYKFGGASVATPDRMESLLSIIQDVQQPTAIIISAIGKTTNALEELVQLAMNDKKEEAMEKCKQLELFHKNYAKELLNEEAYKQVEVHIDELITSLQWSLDDAGIQTKEYVYDQSVSIGELLSSRLLHAYLNAQDIPAEWVDARDVIRTDDHYMDPEVIWDSTENNVKDIILPILNSGKIVVTQGFIGSTSDNNSTTLGREGSDYTAALIGAMLPAGSVSIWKDVEGLLNADPRLFQNTIKIEEITYHEVIEMSYYGAQVIHPKTIKPLQNADIPLYVKCFLNKDLKGTKVTNKTEAFIYPPIIVLKKNQILLQITTKDFSFITEDNLSVLYNLFSQYKLKINLLQNAAISLVACVDHHEDKICQLISALEKDYNLLRNEDVNLITIRHYTPSVVEELTKGRTILLEQKTRNTLQCVVKQY